MTLKTKLLLLIIIACCAYIGFTIFVVKSSSPQPAFVPDGAFARPTNIFSASNSLPPLVITTNLDQP